jgi:hypothetical protein
MKGSMSRRGFLTKTAASGLLAIEGLAPAARAAPAADDGQGRELRAGGQPVSGSVAAAPLVVVACPVSTDTNPRASTWGYLSEILRRAGLFFEQVRPDQLPSPPGRSGQVVVLAGQLPLTLAQRSALSAWVNGGGAIVGIGGTSGLDEVFGVSSTTTLSDGWLKITAQEHPVTAGLRSSLHVFGGCVAKPSAATSLAELQAAGQSPKGATILENRFGKGRALLLTPDLIFSVVHIQQGTRVLGYGKPAPDGTAEVNEGILKAEDGMVLDWQRDRQPMEPEGTPAFLEPVSDELREIILRGIFHLARQQGIAMPVLWYWPQGLKAVGHISHDTDGNDPAKAAALVEVMNRAAVKSTWCTMYPGGYPSEFYTALKDQGFEIALHYDARTGGSQTSWSKENFLLQHRWLMKEAGLRHITTNKNHYTCWEGRLDFFRWCEEVGIECDETRGPSKKGTIGFALGGSQPYFPLDDEADSPRLLNVLEVNLQTQDLVVVCPPEYGRQLLDSAFRRHGVAHFLFHPAHILKPTVADTICGLVDYGRTKGLQWWTGRRIVEWESVRRAVEARFDSPGRVTLLAPRPLAQATLLMLKSGKEPRSLSVNARPVQSMPWTVYGFDFDALTLDLAGEVSVQVA